MFLILVYENEQMFIKSMFTLSEMAGGHAPCLLGAKLCPGHGSTRVCQLSSFLLGVLVWDAALSVFAGLHMAPGCLGAGLVHEVL